MTIEDIVAKQSELENLKEKLREKEMILAIIAEGVLEIAAEMKARRVEEAKIG